MTLDALEARFLAADLATPLSLLGLTAADEPATAEAVAELVDRAFGGEEPAAASVVVHTLPEPGPATRVLERLGFQRRGQDDTVDGPRWRWERAPHGADGFLGTWALDPARCAYEAGEPPRDGLYVLAPRPDGVAFVVDWTDAGGSARHVAFETAFGEKDGLAMERPSHDTLVTRAAGGPVSVARRVLRADRREMTVVQEGTRADGAPFSNTAVYVRVGWAPRAG